MEVLFCAFDGARHHRTEPHVKKTVQQSAGKPNSKEPEVLGIFGAGDGQNRTAREP